MTVRHSTITDNLAQGAPLAAGVAPSQAVLSNSATAGGGVFCLDIFGGPVLIADSTLTGNEAVGGSGPAPALAEGGGISLVLVPSGVVTGCKVVNNVAQGGSGGAGSAGADGVSGGIDLAGGSVVTVSDTLIVQNQAIGGAGGAGSRRRLRRRRRHQRRHRRHPFRFPRQLLADAQQFHRRRQRGHRRRRRLGASGGNAWGGGVSVLAGSSAAIDDALIVLNAALGGSAGTGGASGQGLGGGLFIDAGAGVTLSKSTRVLLNFASTSDDNIFGVYTTS